MFVRASRNDLEPFKPIKSVAQLVDLYLTNCVTNAATGILNTHKINEKINSDR